jgi:hypothetical protein
LVAEIRFLTDPVAVSPEAAAEPLGRQCRPCAGHVYQWLASRLELSHAHAALIGRCVSPCWFSAPFLLLQLPIVCRINKVSLKVCHSSSVYFILNYLVAESSRLWKVAHNPCRVLAQFGPFSCHKVNHPRQVATCLAFIRLGAYRPLSLQRSD